jgi:hypothetical protein
MRVLNYKEIVLPSDCYDTKFLERGLGTRDSAKFALEAAIAVGFGLSGTLNRAYSGC